jgi:hypothetical protein
VKFEIRHATLISLLPLLHLGSVDAVPLYYTFEGTGGFYSNSDQSDFLDPATIDALGNSVLFTFMVDKAQQGTHTYSNGDTVEFQDQVIPIGQNNTDTVTNFILQDSFHVELIESSVFDLVQDLHPDLGNDEPWSGHGSSQAMYRNGIMENEFGTSETFLFGGSQSLGYTQLYINNDISKWEVGTTLTESSMTFFNEDQAAQSSFFASNQLLLTSVSTINPSTVSDTSLVSSFSADSGYADETMPHRSVPEPSTLLLMSVGLLGIARRRHILAA